jgi:exopolyphosphatase/pppGpp-phosphohydrolase
MNNTALLSNIEYSAEQKATMNNEELSKTQAQVSSHQEMTEEHLDAVNAGRRPIVPENHRDRYIV